MNNPDANLDISGSGSKLRLTTIDTSITQMEFFEGASERFSMGYNPTNNRTHLWSDASSKAMILLEDDGDLILQPTSGEVGIGITVPTHKLHVVGGILATSSITASGDISAARYQINGSTVLAVLPGNFSLGIGVDAGKVNTGQQNTFTGYQSGYSNTVGTDNTFNGYMSGNLNVGGNDNIFIGGLSGEKNINGSQNTYLGNSAGRYATGSNNSFVGYLAGAIGGSGSNNTFTGHSAGYYNAGSNNTYMGQNVNYNSMSGYANSIFGASAGVGASENSYSSSTIMGYKAGFVLTGSKNILLGFQAGDSLTSGASNIIIGYDEDTPTETTSNHLNIGGIITGDLISGDVTITGNANADLYQIGGSDVLTILPGTGSIAIGYDAGSSNSQDNNSFLGYYAGSMNSGSDNTFIGANTGRNTKNGSFNTVVGSNAGYGTWGNYYSSNTIVGYKAGYVLDDGGNNNVLLGFQAGDSLISGASNIIIGYD
ncbi:MAG: hypothetical protein KAJ48_10615, partial [Elusimicrobiales bacterium]|nr:hypothetical protein [Elusimicrobiales bacterium]